MLVINDNVFVILWNIDFSAVPPKKDEQFHASFIYVYKKSDIDRQKMKSLLYWRSESLFYAYATIAEILTFRWKFPTELVDMEAVVVVVVVEAMSSFLYP